MRPVNWERMRTATTALFVAGVVVIGAGVITRYVLADRVPPDPVSSLWPAWVLVGAGALLVVTSGVLSLVAWVAEPEGESRDDTTTPPNTHHPFQ